MKRKDANLKLTAKEVAASFADPAWASRFPPVLTTDQAAEILQVPKATIYDWSSRGLLHSCGRRIGKHLRFIRDRLLAHVFNGGWTSMSQEKKRRPKANRFELVGELVRIYCRNGRWYANYQRDGNQYRAPLKTRNQKEAQRRALRLEDQILAGLDPRQPPPPGIDAVIQAYLDCLKTEGRARKTLVKYEAVFGRIRQLAAVRHARNILDLNLAFVDAYRSIRVQDGAAKKTVHTESVVIRQVVNYALSRKMISQDPLEGLKLKEPK